MGLRRIKSLVDGLPASARAHARENGGWTVTDYLLARLIKETDKVYRGVWASVPRPPGTRPPKPVDIQLPGPPKEPRRLTPLEFMRVARTVSNA